jgi:nicotinate-nucleotide adenylyltransferase
MRTSTLASLVVPDAPVERAWLTSGRPGLEGTADPRHFNRLFGDDNWRIRHYWKKKVFDRDVALSLYEEAYYQFFRNNPGVLNWLCRSALEVYELAPSNVDSWLNYYKQECPGVHLSDIAVRRCLKRLGRRLEGDRLIQIGGRDSEGYRLNPGKVPFHDADGILKPSLAQSNRWDENSIEDFWQSNQVLQVRSKIPADVLRNYLLRPLEPVSGSTASVAVFGGSFNPVHLGHLRIAHELIDLYGFHLVVFVPNGNSYRKAGLIHEGHRTRMLALAVEGESRFEVCDHELGRDRLIYTDSTLRHLRALLTNRYGRVRLFNVRGSDIITRMLRWQQLPGILEATQIVPVRPGFDAWQRFGMNSTFRLYSDHFRIMPRQYEDGLSSTVVRERVAASGSLRYLVPDSVADYIQTHDLYRG